MMNRYPDLSRQKSPDIAGKSNLITKLIRLSGVENTTGRMDKYTLIGGNNFMQDGPALTRAECEAGRQSIGGVTVRHSLTGRMPVPEGTKRFNDGPQY